MKDITEEIKEYKCVFSENKVVSEWGDKEYICVGKYAGKPCFLEFKCKKYKPMNGKKYGK